MGLGVKGTFLVISQHYQSPEKSGQNQNLGHLAEMARISCFAAKKGEFHDF